MYSWKSPRPAGADSGLTRTIPRFNTPENNGARLTLLAPARHFDPENPELIDRPDVDPASVRDEMESLEKTNRRSGGHQLVVDYVDRLVRDCSLRKLTVLDLGTGLADIPRALVSWARREGFPIKVIGVDLNDTVLALARRACLDWPEISLVRQDVLSLPYRSDSFDLVMCSHALHHFGAADAVNILRQMQTIARLRYLVNDLRRNWLNVWSVGIVARTFIRHDVLKHDALYSCLAAFTVGELETMAKKAGLTHYRIKRHHLSFRMVLEGRK